MNNIYSFYAKCVSTKCPNHKTCARALSDSKAEVHYWSYCDPENQNCKDYDWFVETVVDVVEAVEESVETQ